MRQIVTAVSCLILLILAVPSYAGTMIQPAAASTNMGNFSGTYNPSFVINQSGLTAPYVSGVTNFDTYVPTTNTVNGGGGLNIWFSAQSVLTGNFEFDLGGSFNIESFALWTDPQAAADQGVNSFALFADDNASFSSPSLLGNYNALEGTGDANNFGQVFSFAPTVATHVRMQINSNYGSTFVTGITEAAFEVVVPEPGSLALLAMAPLALMRRRVI